MRTSRAFMIMRMVILMALLLVLAATQAAAQLSQPHEFYGPVAINGVAAPVSTVISAQTAGGGAATGLQGNPLTTTVVGQYGGAGVVDPRLIVGAAPDSAIDDGEAIFFYVNGVQAQVREVGQTDWLASFPWKSGSRTNLELNATGGPITPTLSVTNSPVTYTGAPQAANVVGSVPGTVSNVRYSGSTTAPTNAGTYVVTANFVPTDTTNYTSLVNGSAGNFVITKATPTLAVTNSPVTYDGTPKTAVVVGSVPGTVSNIRYNGSATAPTNVGTYAVTADFAPSNTTNYNSLVGASAGNFVIESAPPPPDPPCLDPAGFDVVLNEGWSLFSTPVKLAAGSDQLGQIFGANGGAQIFLRWNGQTKQFEQALGTYVLQPLDAIYVRVAAGQTATATLIPSTQLSGIPSRMLYSGANLVGPAPAFDGCRFPDMAVEIALASAAQAPGGLTGYIQVVSPAHNQTGWVYAPGMASQMMQPFKGYWVLMENDDELFGFSTTPL
jgi:hypothetical protein